MIPELSPSFAKTVGELILLVVDGLRLRGGDRVSSTATRSVGDADPGAEGGHCALWHIVGVVGVGHRIHY